MWKVAGWVFVNVGVGGRLVVGVSGRVAVGAKLDECDRELLQVTDKERDEDVVAVLVSDEVGGTLVVGVGGSVSVGAALAVRDVVMDTVNCTDVDADRDNVIASVIVGRRLWERVPTAVSVEDSETVVVGGYVTVGNNVLVGVTPKVAEPDGVTVLSVGVRGLVSVGLGEDVKVGRRLWEGVPASVTVGRSDLVLVLPTVGVPTRD